MDFHNLPQILIAATSPNVEDRQLAHQRLNQLRNQHSTEFLHQIVGLLSEQNRDVHIIAYSYLLNEYILKLNRFPFNLLEPLQQIYENLRILDNEQFTMGAPRNAFKEQNIIRLAVAFLTKPQHAAMRKQYVRNIATSSININPNIIAFYLRSIEGMNQVLSIKERQMAGSAISTLVAIYTQNLWNTGRQECIELAMALSYYSDFFTSFLFENMMVLMNQPNITEQLQLKIIDRLSSALFDNNYEPNFLKCLELYNRIKAIALETRVRNEIFTLKILNLLKGALQSILHVNLSNQNDQALDLQILNLREYEIMIDYLIRTAFSGDQSEEEIRNSISKTCLEIIETYSERIKDQILQSYFDRVRKSINSDNEQKILYLLYGANKQILDLFGFTQIVHKVMKDQIKTSRYIIYYHLIIRYIHFYHYWIYKDEFYGLAQYFRRHIQRQEELLYPINSNEAIAHLQKIVILLDGYSRLAFHPQAQNVPDYFQYFINKAFYYLVHSHFGLPLQAHQSLYDMIMRLIQRNIEGCNFAITKVTLEIYAQNFVFFMGSQLQKRKVTIKVRHQMSVIMREALQQRNLMDEHSQSKLFTIISNFPEADDTTANQIMLLIIKVVKFNNRWLESLENDDYLRQNHNIPKLPLEQLFIPLLQGLFLGDLPTLYNYLEAALESQFVNKAQEMCEDFTRSLRLIFEMMPYEYFHTFIDTLLKRFIAERSSVVSIQMENIIRLAHKRPLGYRQQTERLQVCISKLDCIFEALYINPIWTKPRCITQQRLFICESIQFTSCQERIEKMLNHNLTHLMQNLSFQQHQAKREKWRTRHEQFIQQSSVAILIERWFNTKNPV